MSKVATSNIAKDLSHRDQIDYELQTLRLEREEKLASYKAELDRDYKEKGRKLRSQRRELTKSIREKNLRKVIVDGLMVLRESVADDIYRQVHASSRLLIELPGYSNSVYANLALTRFPTTSGQNFNLICSLRINNQIEKRHMIHGMIVDDILTQLDDFIAEAKSFSASELKGKWTA